MTPQVHVPSILAAKHAARADLFAKIPDDVMAAHPDIPRWLDIALQDGFRAGWEYGVKDLDSQNDA